MELTQHKLQRSPSRHGKEIPSNKKKKVWPRCVFLKTFFWQQRNNTQKIGNISPWKFFASAPNSNHRGMQIGKRSHESFWWVFEVTVKWGYPADGGAKSQNAHMCHFSKGNDNPFSCLCLLLNPGCVLIVTFWQVMSYYSDLLLGPLKRKKNKSSVDLGGVRVEVFL